jgi:hypothetical protein
MAVTNELIALSVHNSLGCSEWLCFPSVAAALGSFSVLD